ncbi:hypothetical protein KPH14_005651 [Odynerus spinipes]|uniref:Uncharacterized protein n=1 Tax=Odynerus spinipes TaxID=1348599 RepID=A0AAD9RAU1_9HYME|nr:hypothetical protein KPH14_005651 [Odynerus spinipes]
MSPLIKACIRILIISCVTSSAFSFPSAYNGVKIVTYGDPCMPLRQLPIQIEGPREPVPPPKNPLKMNLQIIPIVKEYESPLPGPLPVAIQVPQEAPAVAPDCRQGKSYGYNLEVPLTIPQDTSSKSYNFGLQVPVPDEMKTASGQPIKPLTGLTSKVDRILVPACEVANSVKTYGCSSCN